MAMALQCLWIFNRQQLHAQNGHHGLHRLNAQTLGRIGESIFFEAIGPARNPIYIFPRHAQGGGAGPDFLRNSPLIRCRPAL